jgi:hypothetical protein
MVFAGESVDCEHGIAQEEAGDGRADAGIALLREESAELEKVSSQRTCGVCPEHLG